MIAALLPVLAALSPFAAGEAAGVGERFPSSVESFLYEERLWPALAQAEKLAAEPKLSPRERARAWRQAGELRARVGDVSGAAADLEKALAGEPSDSDALLALAVLRRDRPAEALAFAQRAGPSPESDRLAGEILLDLDDAAGARKRLARAVAARPADLSALRALARAAKDAAYARAAAAAAGAAPEWLRGAALRAAADVWLDAGDKTEASRCLRAALALDSGDLDALYALKRLNEQGVARPAGAAPPPASASAWDAEPLPALRARIARALEAKDAERAADLAELFVDAVPRAPSWQRVSAYREIARVWASLGEDLKVRRCLVLAGHLDPSSPATVRLRWELGERGADVRHDLDVVRNAVELARFEAGEPPLAPPPPAR